MSPTEIQPIILNKLDPDPKHVRKTYAPDSVESLAASIWQRWRPTKPCRPSRQERPVLCLSWWAQTGRTQTTTTDTPRFAIVGEATYLEAGGILRKDLFDESGSGIIESPDVLEALFHTEVEAAKAKLLAEGWAWVEFFETLPDWIMVRSASTPPSPSFHQKIKRYLMGWKPNWKASQISKRRRPRLIRWSESSNRRRSMNRSSSSTAKPAFTQRLTTWRVAHHYHQ